VELGPLRDEQLLADVLLRYRTLVQGQQVRPPVLDLRRDASQVLQQPDVQQQRLELPG